MPRGSRFGMLYSGDLARAVAAAIAADPLTGQFELADAAAEGHDWAVFIDRLAEALDRRLRSVPLPAAALWPVAALAETWGAVTRRSAMLTRGKLRELLHPDWHCPDRRFSDETDWAPRVALGPGLALTVRAYRDAGLL